MFPLDSAFFYISNIIKSSKPEYEIENLIDEFRCIMSKKVGILRDKKSLKDAQDFIDLHLHNKNFYNNTIKNVYRTDDYHHCKLMVFHI